jgi:polyferredoxin
MRRFALLLVWLAPIAAWAQEQKKQPPPEFSSGYQPPSPSAPFPRETLFSHIDVAVLVGVLALTAYFVLRRRSRAEVRVLAVFSLLYFGFYRQGCVCAVGSVQNVALALFGGGYALPLFVAAFFAIPLVAALFFGRVFCAAACPLGAAQDVVLHRARPVPAWLEQALGVVPYVYLGAAVLFAATGASFLICEYDPFVTIFRLGGNVWVFAFGVALLLVGMVYGRPYCRFLCPYGVLLRWAGALARWRVNVTPAECTQCHLCADACAFGAIRPSTPDERVDRVAGRRRLGTLVLLLPVLVIVFGWLGYAGSGALSHLHPTVELAERVWLEDQGRVQGTTDASVAFRNLGRPASWLYAGAVVIRHRYAVGCALFGAWVGIVIGVRLILLSVRRRRPDYEADPAACVSCGRCYPACPVHQARLLEERA